LQGLTGNSTTRGAVLDGRTTTCLLKPQSRTAAHTLPAATPAP
jgi:hypothetical protein